MSLILFADAICPSAYSNDTLRHESLGGTEATVVRIAEALDAKVVQHNRDAADGRYLPQSIVPNVSHVVALREVRALPQLRKDYPNAKLYLWLHDLVGQDLVDNGQTLVDTQATIICVSDFHAQQAKDVLSRAQLPGVVIKRIYNPIDDDLVPDATPVDRNKLVFFSSPHKGLDYTLLMFEYIKRLEPEMQLFVANPGYFRSASVAMDGVTDLGPLPHSEVIKHVREALCTFYPNHVFPETFGLVLAESNAVGTPCVAHQFGAAREVLYHPAEVVDAKNYKAVVERVLAWRSGTRPTVRGKPEFRLSQVVRSWKRLLT